MNRDIFLNFGLERIANPLNYFETIYFPYVRFKEEKCKYILEIEMSNIYKKSLNVKCNENSLVVGALRRCISQSCNSKRTANHLAEKFEYIHRDIHFDKRINDKSLFFDFRSDVLYVNLDKVNEDK